MASETLPEKRERALSQREETRPEGLYMPNVDIIEKRDELLLLADVPGAKAGDIAIDYDKGVLTINARVEPRVNEATAKFLIREYGVGDFHRCFHIGEGIDPARIVAEVKEGVLTLHLPKAESAKPRKIQVKSK
jgi:HSP20 family protein